MLFVIGISEAGKIHPYFPNPQEGLSLPIEKNVRNQSFGQGIRLATNHQVGLVRVYALFSDTPLSWVNVAQQLEREFATRRQIPEFIPLGPDIVQDSFWIRVTD